MSVEITNTMWADAQTNIGKLLPENTRRDALHFAVAPVIAGHTLKPGQHIGIAKRDGRAVGYSSVTKIGIVDPFLREHVDIGQRFWLFLYPNTITSLRHVWDHPAFAPETSAMPKAVEVTDDQKDQKAVSEEWLRNRIELLGISNYDEESTRDDLTYVLEAIKSHLLHPSEYDDDDSICIGENIDGNTEIDDEFWTHFETVTGMKVEKRASYFRCAC